MEKVFLKMLNLFTGSADRSCENALVNYTLTEFPVDSSFHQYLNNTKWGSLQRATGESKHLSGDQNHLGIHVTTG